MSVRINISQFVRNGVLLPAIAAIILFTACGQSIKTSQEFSPNRLPQISAINATLPSGVTADTLANGMTIKLVVTADDPEKKPVTYSFSSEQGLFRNIITTGTGCTADFYTTDVLGSGNVYISLTAKDHKGASDTWQNVSVGTGRSFPKVDIDPAAGNTPRDYIRLNDTTKFVFSSTSEGYYQVICDNNAAEADITIRPDEPMYMYTPSGDAANPKWTTVTVASTGSSASSKVKLTLDNAQNNVWFVFWDGLKQISKKKFIITQDSIPPAFNGITPNSTGQAINSSFNVLFYEPVTSSNIKYILSDTDERPDSPFDAPQSSATGCVFNLKENTILNKYETYSLSIDSGSTFTDRAGNAATLNEPKTASFITIDKGQLSPPKIALSAGGIAIAGEEYTFNFTDTAVVYAESNDSGLQDISVSVSSSTGTGSIPTEPSLTYSNPSSISMTLTKNTVIKAIACKRGYIPSSPTVFTIKRKTKTPDFSITGTYIASRDFYANQAEIAISSDGSDIFYSESTGSISAPPAFPVTSETPYLESIIKNGHNSCINIRAIAVAADMEPSDPKTETVKIKHNVIPTPQYVLVSNNAQTYSAPNYTCIAVNTTGQYLAAAADKGYIYTSVDAGNTWIEQLNSGQRAWKAIHIADADGSGNISIVAAETGGKIWRTSDFTTAGNISNWQSKTADNANWSSLTGSANGSIYAATIKGGRIVISTDHGNTWISQTFTPILNWNQIITDTAGSKFIAIADNTKYIYYGTFDGTTWSWYGRSKGLAEPFTQFPSMNYACVAATSDLSEFYVSAKDTSAATYYFYKFDEYWNLTDVYGSSIAENYGVKVLAHYFNGSKDFFMGSAPGATSYYGYPYISFTMPYNPNYHISNYSGLVLTNGGNTYFGTNGFIQTGSPDTTEFSPETINESGTRYWTSIASSHNGNKLFATASSSTNGDYVYTSTDSGSTWTERKPFTSGPLKYKTAASSADGSILITAVYGGYIYTSSDSGNNWTVHQGATVNGTYQPNALSRSWIGTAASDNGAYIYSLSSSFMAMSADSGANWTAVTLPAGSAFSRISCDPSGRYVIITENGTGIYISTDYGTSWLSIGSSGSKSWTSIAISDYNLNQISYIATTSSEGSMSNLPGTIYKGILYFATEGNFESATTSSSGSSGSWICSTISYDGSFLSAADKGGYIWTSIDSGDTWNAQTNTGIRYWTCTASTYSGLKIIAGADKQRSVTILE